MRNEPDHDFDSVCQLIKMQLYFATPIRLAAVAFRVFLIMMKFITMHCLRGTCRTIRRYGSGSYAGPSFFYAPLDITMLLDSDAIYIPRNDVL